jgi:hypothetical protein
MGDPSPEQQRNTYDDRSDKLRKRKFVGTGVVVARNDVSKLSARAKGILNELWHQHKMDNLVPLMLDDGDCDTTTGVEFDDRAIITNRTNKIKVAGFVDSTNQAELTDSEKKVVNEARKGKFSLFLSILTIIEEHVDPIPTKYVLRKLSLILRPSDVPPIMDSKDIILAALHFLSSTYECESDEFLSLPLIVAAQTYSDMEKRNYQKATPWTLDSIKDKIMKMEDLFFRSPTSYKWLPREVLTPSTLFADEERDFFMKGFLSESISARKNRSGEAAARKRRRQEAKARAAAAAAAASGKSAVSSVLSTKSGVDSTGKERKDNAKSSEENTDDDSDDDDSNDDDDDSNDDDDDDDDDVIEATVLED